MAKKEMAIYAHPQCVVANNKFVWMVEDRTVRVMARAEGYAMVRYSGCVPFIAKEKDLSPV